MIPFGEGAKRLLARGSSYVGDKMYRFSKDSLMAQATCPFRQQISVSSVVLFSGKAPGNLAACPLATDYDTMFHILGFPVFLLSYEAMS